MRVRKPFDDYFTPVIGNNQIDPYARIWQTVFTTKTQRRQTISTFSRTLCAFAVESSSGFSRPDRSFFPVRILIRPADSGDFQRREMKDKPAQRRLFS
jgi:hypothetical protein